MEMTFKSFRELNEYLTDTEMIDLEELTEALLGEPTEREVEDE